MSWRKIGEIFATENENSPGGNKGGWPWRHHNLLLTLSVLHACWGEQPDGFSPARGSPPLPCIAARARLEGTLQRSPLFRTAMEAGGEDGQAFCFDDDDDDAGETHVGLLGGDRDLGAASLKAERGMLAGQLFDHVPLLLLSLKLRGGASSGGDDSDDGHGLRWREIARDQQQHEESRRGPKLGRGEEGRLADMFRYLATPAFSEGGPNLCHN